MVSLDNLVTIEHSSGPQVINHYNLFRSAEIDGSAAPGYSTGEGLKAMEELAKKNMMPGMTYSWTGLALEEIQAGGKIILIFGLGILVVYLTLSAQYESFTLPFIILLAVPMAVLGALGAVSPARLRQRRLLSDRTGDADRPFGEELHSDRRVCRTDSRNTASRLRKLRSRQPSCG